MERPTSVWLCLGERWGLTDTDATSLQGVLGFVEEASLTLTEVGVVSVNTVSVLVTVVVLLAKALVVSE